MSPESSTNSKTRFSPHFLRRYIDCSSVRRRGFTGFASLGSARGVGERRKPAPRGFAIRAAVRGPLYPRPAATLETIHRRLLCRWSRRRSRSNLNSPFRLFTGATAGTTSGLGTHTVKARTSSVPARLARCSMPPARAPARRSALVQRDLSREPVPSPAIVPPYG